MVRSLDAPYKFGRSTLAEGYLLKIKPFEDSEAAIIDLIEMQINENPAYTNNVGTSVRSKAKSGLRPGGTLGAMLVRDIKTNTEFKIGLGHMDAREKAKWWKNREEIKQAGLIVTYTWQKCGTKNAPRSGNFKAIRAPMDVDV